MTPNDAGPFGAAAGSWLAGQLTPWAATGGRPASTAGLAADAKAVRVPLRQR
jgi:hypothetical protein